MVVRHAHGWLHAILALGARVNAFLVDARLLGRAFAVALARHVRTADLRIAGQTGRAFAYGTMLDAVTLGVRAAGAAIGGASWHAGSILANILTGAVVVATTTG